MRYGLAIHTTTAELGLCLGNREGICRFQQWLLERELSNYLHEKLLAFLAPQTWSDLELIAVANGPGSFTSTRIGVVTARTLGQQLDIPVYGISALASLAWCEHYRYPQGKHLAVEMKATREQLYVAIYQASAHQQGLIAHLPDSLVLPQTWQETLNHWHDDYQLIKSPANLGFTSKSLLELAYLSYQNHQIQTWQQVSPFYS